MQICFDEAADLAEQARDLSDRLAGRFGRRLRADDFDFDSVREFAQALKSSVFWLKKAEKVRQQARTSGQPSSPLD